MLAPHVQDTPESRIDLPHRLHLGGRTAACSAARHTHASNCGAALRCGTCWGDGLAVHQVRQRIIPSHTAPSEVLAPAPRQLDPRCWGPLNTGSGYKPPAHHDLICLLGNFAVVLGI